MSQAQKPVQTTKAAQPVSNKPAEVKKVDKKEPVKIDTSPEAKTKRFKTIAGRRTKKIIVTLANLGNCSNKSVYAYTEDQINQIFTAIEKQMKATREKFVEKSKSGKPDFTLE